MEDIHVVSKIVSITQKKCNIYLNEQFAFALYKGELSRYKLKEGVRLSEETYHEIQTLLLKRAKSRCLHLLNAKSYTQQQLTEKLQTNGYPDEVTTQAIDYAKSFGYINDKAYAQHYILNQNGKRSIREMKEKLLQKGITREVLEECLETLESEQDDTHAIKTILKKKKYAEGNMNMEEKRKIYAYLARKGFRYDDINKVLQISNWNT